MPTRLHLNGTLDLNQVLVCVRVTVSLRNGIRSFMDNLIPKIFQNNMSNQSENTRIALNDVYILRPIAVFFIIVYHAFIIYRGGWAEPIGFQEIDLYHTIATVSYAFWLELFVFISGYVFALSLQRKQPNFISMTISKFRRLIVPSIIFSIAYYFIFYYPKDFSISHCVMKNLSGAGHMWFLPMLFWTTLLCFVIDNVKVSISYKLLIVCALPILSVLPLPFQIGNALYYTLFFYTGMIVFRNKEGLINKLAKYNVVILLVACYVFTFSVGSYLQESTFLNTDAGLLIKGVTLLLSKYIRILYSAIGILCLYSLANYLIEKKVFQVPQWVINLSPLCFGIYLFQQFILQYLYYKTNIPSLVGPYLLPWIALIITLVFSYFFAVLIKKTRLGEILIG